MEASNGKKTKGFVIADWSDFLADRRVGWLLTWDERDVKDGFQKALLCVE